MSTDRKYTAVALETFQRCQQQYWFKYVEELEPQQYEPSYYIKQAISAFLYEYYSTLRLRQHLGYPRDASLDAEIAHSSAKAYSEFGSILDAVEAIAKATFSDGDLSDEYYAVRETVNLIISHYMQIRGEDDAKEQEILDVQPYENGIHMTTRDRQSGTIIVWQHDISKEAPPKDGLHLEDLRMLGSVKVRSLDFASHLFRFNHIHSDVPHQPSINKNGSISRNISSTTWATFASVVLLNGGKLEDYKDMEAKLSDRETMYYFPRIDYELNGERFMLARNQRMVLNDAKNLVMTRGTPRTHFSHYCATCPYTSLCAQRARDNMRLDELRDAQVYGNYKRTGVNNGPSSEETDSLIGSTIDADYKIPSHGLNL